MVLRKLILIVSLFSSAAYGSGEFGFSPGMGSNGNSNYKYFFSVYENLGGDYYINPYYQYDNDFNLRQHFVKLDFNKHVNNKFIVGIGISNTDNNYFKRQDIKANLIIKLW